MIEKLSKPKPKQTPSIIELNDIEEISPSRADLLYTHDIEIYIDLTDVYLIYLNKLTTYNTPYAVKQFMFRCTVESWILMDAPAYVELEMIAYIVSNYTLMFLDKLSNVLDTQQEDYINYFEEIVYHTSSVIDIATAKIMTVLKPKQINIDDTIPAYWNSITRYDLNADVVKENEITLSETLVLVAKK
jgi:hypothetical protein